MKKLSMISQFSITFEQGCDRYILNCKQRNLRQGTINHYKQSYVQFYKYFDRNMLLSEITERTYKDYVVYLCDTLENDVSVNSYLRDLITTFHFWMNEGYIPHFKMQAIKVDKHSIETYSDGELKILLQKPDLRKCKFTEYQCWVQTNFLFSTGVRQFGLRSANWLGMDITKDQLMKVNKEIKGWNYWDLYFNCTFFASKVWNSVSDKFFMPMMFPVFTKAQANTHGGNKNVAMQPHDNPEDCFKQRGSGDGAKLETVSSGSLKTRIG